MLGLHGLFAWLTWHEMRLMKGWEPGVPEHHEALVVRLIPRESTPAAPAAPAVPLPTPARVAEPAPLPARTPSRPVVHEAPAKNAMTVSLPSPPAPATSRPPAAASRPYDASGQPVAPASASTAPAAPEAGYAPPGVQGDTRLMQHTTTVPYKATRFEKDWDKGGGSSIDDALKKAVDKSTVTHTFHIAPGVRIHCSVSLAALGGGCGGDPPPPPPSNDGDMRMNMAPASQLAPGSPAPKAVSVDECIAIYRAEKPLPYGCPVDTPTRAVDAEMQERAAHPPAQDGGG